MLLVFCECVCLFFLFVHLFLLYCLFVLGFFVCLFFNVFLFLYKKQLLRFVINADIKVVTCSIAENTYNLGQRFMIIFFAMLAIYLYYSYKTPEADFTSTVESVN